MTKISAERLTAFGMILVAGYFVLQSLDMPSTSGIFPQFTGYVVIFLALIMIVRTFLTHDKKLAGVTTFDFSYTGMKPVYVMVVGAIYGYAIFVVGFYVTSVVFFFLVTYMTGIRSWKMMAGTAVVLFPLMYAFFNLVLTANLPEGFLI